MSTLWVSLDQWIVTFWNMALHGCPWFLLGLVCAGLLRSFLRLERFGRWLSTNSAGAAVRAAVIGTPLPLCSCSVVPVALQLHRQGASRSATQSFLITAPATGVDSIAVTAAYLGPWMALLRTTTAVMAGLLAGSLESLRSSRSRAACQADGTTAGAVPASATTEPVSSSAEPAPAGASRTSSTALPAALAAADGRVTTANHGATSIDEANERAPTARSGVSSARSWMSRLIEGQRYAFGPMLAEVAPWMLVGLALAAALAVALPPAFLSERWAGVPWWAWYLIMLVVGLPSYLCAAGMTPMIAVLMAKGVGPGAALVLMVAGPATSLATLAIVRRHLGWTSMWLYMLAISTAAVSMALIADGVIVPLGSDLLKPRVVEAAAGYAGLLFPWWFAVPATVLLLLRLIEASSLAGLRRVVAATSRQRATASEPQEVPRGISRRLLWPLRLAAAVVLLVAWLSLPATVADATITEAIGTYNTRRSDITTPAAAAQRAPQGTDPATLPPVAWSVADLHQMATTRGPDNRPLIAAYHHRLVRILAIRDGEPTVQRVPLFAAASADPLSAGAPANPASRAGTTPASRAGAGGLNAVSAGQEAGGPAVTWLDTLALRMLPGPPQPASASKQGSAVEQGSEAVESVLLHVPLDRWWAELDRGDQQPLMVIARVLSDDATAAALAAADEASQSRADDGRQAADDGRQRKAAGPSAEADAIAPLAAPALAGTSFVLVANTFERVTPQVAADLGLLEETASAWGDVPRAPIDQLTELATTPASSQPVELPMPPALLALAGQQVRFDGYYVWQFEDNGVVMPVIGSQYFDGACCGVPPTIFNAVRVRSVAAAAANVAPELGADPTPTSDAENGVLPATDPTPSSMALAAHARAANAAIESVFGGLTLGQRVRLVGTLQVRAVVPADRGDFLVELGDVSLVSAEGSLQAVRTTLLLLAGLSLLIFDGCVRAWRRQIAMGRLIGSGWATAGTQAVLPLSRLPQTPVGQRHPT